MLHESKSDYWDNVYVTHSQVNSSNEFGDRLQQLDEFYCAEFNKKPNFFVRVPGRVNIIGEHVDYCGYPVLPLAIKQCVMLAVGFDSSRKDSILDLRNVDVEKYSNYLCDLKHIKIAAPRGCQGWYNYYLCGIQGIFEMLNEDVTRLSMTIALHSDIPSASGVSSSSALVCAAALATAKVHGFNLERKSLAIISARSECYIGMKCGGMDQAIAYLGQEGCAQFIEFYPDLKATPLKLLPKVCFVVANSLAEMNKAATSDFNERVIECHLSCCLLAHKQLHNQWQTIKHLKQLQDILCCNLIELECLVMKYLPDEQYTRADLCHLFNISEKEFQNNFLTPNTLHMQTFKLRQRILHVIQESLRVQKFCKICEMYQNEGIGDNISDNNYSNEISQLSLILKQSHESLKILYECSHPNLDRLISLSQEFGIEARLTGAGWGGCIVALCDSTNRAREYITWLKEKYYYRLPDYLLKEHSMNDFNNVIFTTKPCNGAEIFLPSIID